MLTRLIKEIFVIGRSVYGTRRIRKELLKQGHRLSRRRVAGLMEAAGLVVKTKRKFKATTNSNHNHPISPNFLSRNFMVTAPNQCWCGDITYIRTSEGWLYLAIVMDLFSRKIVGWSMNHRMTAQLVNQALLHAIWSRKPPRGLIWHTDRGSQYAAKSHRLIMKAHGIKQSMSRKGDCWDNAPAESFFSTLKTELVYLEHFKTRDQARQAIFEYIEVFYNRIRTHSANDYVAPQIFEDHFRAA